MIELPDSETYALNALQAFDLHGNWPIPVLRGVAYAVMRHGGTETDYEELVNSSALAEALATKQSNWSKLLPKAWGYAEDNFEPAIGRSGNTLTEDLEELFIRVFFDDYPEGPKGVTERRIALGLILAALNDGRARYTFECSARYLAGLAGVPDPKKVSTTLPALEGKGLVSVNRNGRRTNRVHVHMDYRRSVANDYKQLLDVIRLFVVDYDRDLWTTGKGGLGPVAGCVYLLLRYVMGTEGAKRPAIGQWLGFKPTAVKTAVSKLVKHGLVKESSDGFLVGVDFDLDTLEAALGVAGYRARLREKFDSESAGNRRIRQDWHAEHKPSASVQEKMDEAEAFYREMEAARIDVREWFSERTGPPVLDPFLSAPLNRV